MTDLKLFLNFSFAGSSCFIYRNPETPPPSAGADYEDISEGVRSLEDSQDADVLRETLTGFIVGKYPEFEDRVTSMSIGDLLDGMAELGYANPSDPPSKMLEDMLEMAFEFQYPNGYGGEVQHVIDRTMAIVRSKSKPRRRSDVQAKAHELIERKKEKVSSPRLRELRSQLRDLNEQYNEYYELANRAAVQYMKYEANLKKIMEGYGFQYDSSGKQEMYYYFTDKLTLEFDDHSSNLTDAERSRIEKAASSWSSFGWHFRRLNRQVDSIEARARRIEAEIAAEEKKG